MTCRLGKANHWFGALKMGGWGRFLAFGPEQESVSTHQTASMFSVTASVMAVCALRRAVLRFAPLGYAAPAGSCERAIMSGRFTAANRCPQKRARRDSNPQPSDP